MSPIPPPVHLPNSYERFAANLIRSLPLASSRIFQTPIQNARDHFITSVIQQLLTAPTVNCTIQLPESKGFQKSYLEQLEIARKALTLLNRTHIPLQLDLVLVDDPYTKTSLRAMLKEKNYVVVDDKFIEAQD